MERLTKPDSDYCHDICGSVNGCPRLTGGKKRCRGYDLYERLKQYENLWSDPEKMSIRLGLISIEEARHIHEMANESHIELLEASKYD